MTLIQRLLTALVLVSFLPGSPSFAQQNTETKAQRDERMRWWREARFGMFIHWGVYAVPLGIRVL
jgi:alpha-L-fucosidase